MENIIYDVYKKQTDFFKTNTTKNNEFIIQKLKRLKKEILSNYENIVDALKKDLNKSEQESYISEFLIVVEELKTILKNIKKWSKIKKVKRNLLTIFSKSKIIKEPLGTVLIISPWNYPFQLCLVPLIYALAAGNTAILYPSLFTKKINQVIKNIISSVFEKEYVNIVTYEECGYEEILKPNYSFIFFTGGVETGKKIMKQASEALTPICLELGGKCPCIIDQTADLDITAKRIIRGKILNSGQTCIAPDYILVQKNMEEELIKKLIKYIQEFFVSDSYEQNTKIINEFHFERIINLLKKQKILFMNGKIEKEKLFIPFALVKVDNFENILMKEEIFGPILPIISFENINDEIKNIHKLYKPLALYIFSNSKQNQEFCIKNISSGSVCINDTIMHLVNSNLPFGGVGHSGFGKYHGIEGFNLFCNIRSYLNTSNQLDSNLFYPPWTDKKIKFLKKFTRTNYCKK